MVVVVVVIVVVVAIFLSVRHFSALLHDSICSYASVVVETITVTTAAATTATTAIEYESQVLIAVKATLVAVKIVGTATSINFTVLALVSLL